MKLFPIQWIDYLDLRKTLIALVICLGLFALNIHWQDSLRQTLESEQATLGESLALLKSESEFKGKESELDSFTAIKSGQSNANNWTEQVPSLVAAHKLILRQVRPLGISEKGKDREEKLYLQVDGDVDGFLAFLQEIASFETPLYVQQYLVTTRSIGSGFISVEMVISRILF